MANGERIPIAAARRICDEYGYDQVVIFARKTGEGGKEHVTTYGRSLEHCDIAARMGNNLKRHVGWPESKCQDVPSRIKRRDTQKGER